MEDDDFDGIEMCDTAFYSIIAVLIILGSLCIYAVWHGVQL